MLIRCCTQNPDGDDFWVKVGVEFDNVRFGAKCAGSKRVFCFVLSTRGSSNDETALPAFTSNYTVR